MKRRDFLGGAAGALALPRAALAQVDPLDPLVRALSNGAPVRKGKVTLVLPQLADNGNSVPIRIAVDSPMTAADHVSAGKAEINSRVRLAGSQRVTAVAKLSDGSFWYDAAPIVVTLSACLDES